MRQLKETLTKAVKENEVKLPAEILDQMPPIPDQKKIPQLPENVSYRTAGSFSSILVETNTRFLHLRFCLETSTVPQDVRPYLVLFQELLLESDLALPGQPIVPWNQVVKQTSDDLVTFECGVGFGNATFTCSYLPSLFYIYGISERHQFEKLCDHISNMVLFLFFLSL